MDGTYCLSLRDANRVFSHDVTAAILESQLNPMGVELFSYANALFFSINLHRCWPREWKHSVNVSTIVHYFRIICYGTYRHTRYEKDSWIYTLLISLGAILNFQRMTSFAERLYTWPKWLPKMKILLTLILQCVHIKRNVFTFYQEEYFLHTMSLWVCYRNFRSKVFVDRRYRGQTRADLNAR